MRLPARILSSLPVRGWRTLRAARLARRKLPKPVTEKVPSFFRFLRIVSNTTSTQSRAARPDSRRFFFTASIKIALLIESIPLSPRIGQAILCDPRAIDNRSFRTPRDRCRTGRRRLAGPASDGRVTAALRRTHEVYLRCPAQPDLVPHRDGRPGHERIRDDASL